MTINVLYRGTEIKYNSKSKDFSEDLQQAIKTVGGDRSVINNKRGSIWKNNKKIASFKITQ